MLLNIHAFCLRTSGWHLMTFCQICPRRANDKVRTRFADRVGVFQTNVS